MLEDPRDHLNYKNVPRRSILFLTCQKNVCIYGHIMEQKDTKKTIRIAAELEPELIQLVDEEAKGLCSRATIVRLALLDRYGKKRRANAKVA